MDPNFVSAKLREWDLLQYVELFQEHQIDQATFLQMSADTVKELIPLIGHRVKFLQMREKIKQSLNVDEPIGNNESDEHSIDPVDTTVRIQKPVLSKSTSSEPTGKELKRLLSDHPRGKCILNCTRLTANDRGKICEIIVDHLLSASKITSADWEFWAREICCVFKFEQSGIYYKRFQTNPRRLASGKLWDRYCNARRYIRLKCKGLAQQQEQTTVVTVEMNDILEKLGTISPQDKELESLWRETHHYRKNTGTIREYFEKYPVLSSTVGSSLLIIDFIEAKWIDDPQIFISSWKELSRKIFQFAQSKKVCQHLLKEQATPETLALLTLPFLFRTSRISTKRGTNWRPSQLEVAEAFVLQVEHAGDLEGRIVERQTKLSKYGLTQQPYVATIGSKTSFSEIFVIVDQARYQCSTLVLAVDLCFKAIWTLSAKYQPECEAIWKLLEQFVYKMKENNKISNKCSQISQALWADIEGYCDALNVSGQ